MLFFLDPGYFYFIYDFIVKGRKRPVCLQYILEQATAINGRVMDVSPLT